jgi:hypothetical protein
MTRHSDPPFDQRIADWLELDPNTAPDAALDTVLAAFPSIPQRRRGFGLGGWRTNPMTSTLKLALGAAATIAVVVAGFALLGPRTSPGVGGEATPSPSASPTPAPTGGWRTFSSDRFRYTIEYPADWVVTAAAEAWPADGWPDPKGDGVDRFGPTAASTTWTFVVSEELDPGETAADRRSELDGLNADICDVAGSRTVTVDGVEARMEEQFCFGADRVIETMAISGTRVYLIDWFSASDITDADRAIYEAILESVRFTE